MLALQNSVYTWSALSYPVGLQQKENVLLRDAFQYTARKCEVLSNGDWTRHLLILVAHPVCSHEALFTSVGCEGHRSQTKHDWRDEPVLPHAWFMWKNMLQSARVGVFSPLYTCPSFMDTALLLHCLNQGVVPVVEQCQEQGQASVGFPLCHISLIHWGSSHHPKQMAARCNDNLHS